MAFLDGQQFTALNGGPNFKFTEAVSFVVNCDTQEEVDKFWEQLSQGGQKVECGWLKDKFGLSWQVVPTVLIEMVQDKNPARVERVMKAMLQIEEARHRGSRKGIPAGMNLLANQKKRRSHLAPPKTR